MRQHNLIFTCFTRLWSQHFWHWLFDIFASLVKEVKTPLHERAFATSDGLSCEHCAEVNWLNFAVVHPSQHTYDSVTLLNLVSGTQGREGASSRRPGCDFEKKAGKVSRSPRQLAPVSCRHEEYAETSLFLFTCWDTFVSNPRRFKIEFTVKQLEFGQLRRTSWRTRNRSCALLLCRQPRFPVWWIIDRL